MIANILFFLPLFAALSSPTNAIFPFGPAFIFSTSSRPPVSNNTAGSFSSTINFDAITNVSNVVVAVSQTMGRSLDTDLDIDEDTTARRINSTVFLFRDGNWTSFKLRKRRSTFDLGRQITNQVFAAVNAFVSQTANATTFDLMDKLLNASALNRSSRSHHEDGGRPVSRDPFRGVEIFDESSRQFLDVLQSFEGYSRFQRSIPQRISRRLAAGRSAVWRTLFSSLKDFLEIVNTTMATMHDLFNSSVDLFAQTIDTNSDCWPSDALAGSSSANDNLFRTSADNMGRCFGNLAQISHSLLDELQRNVSAPLSVPSRVVQLFDDCRTATEGTDIFGLLAQSTCLAKVPLVLEDFALTQATRWNHLVEEGQQALIHLQGSMLQCGVTELETVQEKAIEWQTSYAECVAEGTTTMSSI